MPNDLPPRQAVYQQTRRWLEADVFASMVADLRILTRLGQGRTLQSTRESGHRAGWDGAKRRKGTKVHLALHVTPANAQDRSQAAELAAAVQAETDEAVTLAYVDAGYTGGAPRAVAAAHGIALSVVALPEAKWGFALLPRRWVVEREFPGRANSGGWRGIRSGWPTSQRASTSSPAR